MTPKSQNPVGNFHTSQFRGAEHEFDIDISIFYI